MIIKKSMIFILVIALYMGIIGIDTFAAKNEQVNIYNLSDYEYYSTFAKALQEHNYELIAKYIPCTDPKQFKYSGITIKEYSIELLEKSRNYSRGRCAANITLNITKSNNSLFSKGKYTYYAYIDLSEGLNGVFEFYPLLSKPKAISKKYSDGLWISLGVASYMTDYESASSSKIKKMEYDEGYIHYFYHVCLQDDYPDGISKAALTTELNKFYGSKKQISKEVLDELWKKDGLYFKQCGHGMPIDVYSCQKITKNKKTGYYTYDIWFYSDAAAMNVCRKIKFTYDISDGDYVLKQVNCYYSNDYDVMSL